MTAQTERCKRFHALHESGCFMLPNPWDVGSARLLEQLGFSALATTSAGLAWSLGCRDSQVSLEATILNLRAIAGGVDVPVNADFEGGFAIGPVELAENVTAAVSTGIAGLSIEDATGDPLDPLFEFSFAVERIRSARQAIDQTGVPVVLTARTEGFRMGRPDLGETIRRLSAFADAGADCLYAPALHAMSDIRAVVEAVAPKPVNVLVGTDFTTVAELAGAGVRRISVGGGLARAAWAGFLATAREIAAHGTFNHLAKAVPFAEIDGAFERS